MTSRMPGFKHAALLLLTVVTSAFVSAVSAGENAKAEALAPQVAEAEAVGRAIYRHDHAASVATDALDEITFRQDNRLAGWITEEQGDSIAVTFAGGEGRKPELALYRVVVSADGKAGEPQELKPGVPLSDEQRAQFAARSLAAKQKFETLCTPQFNTVVLARGSGDKRTWAVYMLPGTSDPNVLPAGGAYRIETDWKGSRVLSKRAFTKSCLAMPMKDGAESMVLTHLLDPQPTEFHVFLNLLGGKPIFVATAKNELLWGVREGKIEFLDSMSDAKK